MRQKERLVSRGCRLMGRYCAKAILSFGSGNRDQSEQGVKNFVFKPYSCLIVGHYSHEVANTFSVLNLFSFLNLVSIPIPPSPPFLCPSLLPPPSPPTRPYSFIPALPYDIIPPLFCIDSSPRNSNPFWLSPPSEANPLFSFITFCSSFFFRLHIEY